MSIVYNDKFQALLYVRVFACLVRVGKLHFCGKSLPRRFILFRFALVLLLLSLKVFLLLLVSLCLSLFITNVFYYFQLLVYLLCLIVYV